MKRTDFEKDYWNNASKDPQVKVKYISDMPVEDDLTALGELKGKVLEIGCGIGRLMKKDYCGIDISEGMLELARKNRPDCEFKLCNGREIPYPDETFDSVYSVLLFQHLPLEAVNNYIAEVYRVLKKDGIFRFQFIEGAEDGQFSKHHSMSDLQFGRFEVDKTDREMVHPLWTWVTLKK